MATRTDPTPPPPYQPKLKLQLKHGSSDTIGTHIADVARLRSSTLRVRVRVRVKGRHHDPLPFVKVHRLHLPPLKRSEELE